MAPKANSTPRSNVKIKQVLDKRGGQNEEEYLLSFEGEGQDQNRWEPKGAVLRYGNGNAKVRQFEVKVMNTPRETAQASAKKESASTRPIPSPVRSPRQATDATVSIAFQDEVTNFSVDLGSSVLAFKLQIEEKTGIGIRMQKLRSKKGMEIKHLGENTARATTPRKTPIPEPSLADHGICDGDVLCMELNLAQPFQLKRTIPPNNLAINPGSAKLTHYL